MEVLVHPAQLSTWQRFLQARRLHRETTRSRNLDWYREALDLECQLHLFLEGEDISEAHICFGKEARKTWGRVAVPSLQAGEQEVMEYLAGIRSQFKGKMRSLAVILHVADEFAISELAGASERPGDLSVLSGKLVHEPKTVLEDHSDSVEDLSFRLFPYPGSKLGQQFGSAITISRRCQTYLRQIRNVGQILNFPIRTSALSAPLVTLGALPRLAEDLPSEPFAIFFSYSSFSVIAFFAGGRELVMLRSVRHHEGTTPSHVGRIVQTMAAALELPEPTVYTLPLSRPGRDSVAPGLPGTVVVDWRKNSWFDSAVPLEFQGPSSLISGNDEGLCKDTETFRGMIEGGWATQDFLPAARDEVELFPSRTEMRILRFGSAALRLGIAAIVLLLGWTGVRGIKIINDESWHQTGEVSREGNKILSSEIRRYEQWSSLLADRSKAWVSMELVNQLFPDPESVILSEASHRVRPELVQNKDTKAGVVKDWTISGFSNADALNHLTVISSTKGMGEVFDSIHEQTGNESFRADLGSRTLLVNLLTSENTRFKPVGAKKPEERFAHNFRLTITQRVTAEDPIAIPIIAAP
ncbi:MAG: hypothetical protein CMP30_05080 [Roseibacillus sp.]|nr:hypothetical protein [Roseibacillus sp.]